AEAGGGARLDGHLGHGPEMRRGMDAAPRVELVMTNRHRSGIDERHRAPVAQASSSTNAMFPLPLRNALAHLAIDALDHDDAHAALVWLATPDGAPPVPAGARLARE